MREGINLRFNQTLQNYIKVGIGKTVFNPINSTKNWFVDKTIIKFTNTGDYV